MISIEASALDDILRDLIKKVYAGIVKSGNITKKLLKETQSTFTKALLKGYGKDAQVADYDTPDYYSLRFLKNNLSAFSAARSFTQIKEMSALLTDENGNRRSFDQFKTEVEKLNIEFNKNWLETEYDTAFANAQMARSWNDIQANDGFTDITIYTAGDERVRDEHWKYEGFTRPKNDPIWASFWPPFDWRCRCIASESTAPASGAVELNDIPVLFRNNPGVSGIAFDTSHPYFDRIRDNAQAVAYPVAAAIDELSYRVYQLSEFSKDHSSYTDALPTSNIKEEWDKLLRSSQFKNEDAIVLSDANKEQVKLEGKLALQMRYLQLLTGTLWYFDEQWLKSKAERVYFSVWDNGVLTLRVNREGVVTSFNLLDFDQANALRSGVLILA